jgi:hypothetical protein
VEVEADKNIRVVQASAGRERKKGLSCCKAFEIEVWELIDLFVAD